MSESEIDNCSVQILDPDPVFLNIPNAIQLLFIEKNTKILFVLCLIQTMVFMVVFE